MIMDSEQQSRPVLDPYKTIGCFTHGPLALSRANPFAFAAATYNSFKVYSGELAIKLVSPAFNKPIRALQTANEFSYVLVGNELYKMRYHHIAGHWRIPLGQSQKKIKSKNHNLEKKKANMLLFSDIVMISEGSIIHVVDERAGKIRKSSQNQNILTEEEGESLGVQQLDVDFEIQGLVHPRTYLNKVLVHSHNRLLLVNPISKKILYEYSRFVQDNITVSGNLITLVQATPLVDIVAVGADSGEIFILNIRQSSLVFKMKQKRAVTALAFSEDAPYMASADERGNIILWHLEDKRIIYRLEAAIQQSIDHLFFVPGFELLVASSSFANVIRQFRINRDDAKTLTLFRERVGSNESIQQIKVHSNKQITYSTQSAVHFTSLYSHCNNYSLPVTTTLLDSSLPYHLLVSHFNVEVYKERTLVCKTNLHEVAELGAISISQKYAVVATKSKIVKISISVNKDNKRGSLIAAESPLNEINPSEIHLFNEQYVYLVCFEAIFVFDFTTLQMVSAVAQGCNCYHLVASPAHSLLAFENRTTETVQVWDGQKISCGRRFSLQDSPTKSQTTALCFTPQNRFVLSAHADSQILIWSMMENVLYKTLTLEAPLKTMFFTPDGGYFLSVFMYRKEINIWNNYIGKITTSQASEEHLQFKTQLKEMHEDYRVALNQETYVKDQSYGQKFAQELDDLLENIPDAEDGEEVENYQFSEVNKWTPLVYYDEIKARNTIQGEDDLKATSSIPFFLDFKNIDEQKEKLQRQIKKQMLENKQKKQEKRDKLLSEELHQINLQTNSTAYEIDETWQMLCSLSVAEADYQLRRFLLTPTNGPILMKMFTRVFGESKFNSLQVNVLLTRFLDLMGGDLLSQEMKASIHPLREKVSQRAARQDRYVQRSLAIIDRN